MDSTCEVYGFLHVNIGNRPGNQNIELWRKYENGGIDVPKRREHHIDIQHVFQEYMAFTLSQDSVTFTGEFKEDDGITSDDRLAVITGQTNAIIRANEIYNTYKTERFTGGSNWVEIMVRLTTSG